MDAKYKLILLLLLPFVCNGQNFPLRVGNFISAEQANGYTMRGVDITEALHDVVTTHFNCIDLGYTCADVSANLVNAYPFVGTTLTSQTLDIITAVDVFSLTGSPTANDGSMTFNGTTQWGAKNISGSTLPTGTGALTLNIFFKFASNASAFIFGIGDNSATGSRFCMFYQSNALFAEANGENAQFGWTFVTSWHMLTISKPSASGTPANFKIYLDGALQTKATTGTTAVNIPSGGEMTIARKIGVVTGTLSFPGTLKFPMIWSRQLSDAEVTQLWTIFRYLVGA